MTDENNFQDDPELTESEYNPSAGIEDLLNEEEEDLSPQPTKLKTGIGGNQRPDRPKPVGVNPNAFRYLFNPFETIDVRNEPAGCGFDFVENVVFHKVKSLDTNVAKTDTYDLPGAGHNDENYENFRRTAHMIAIEMVSKHGDKGVIVVSSLTGQNEEIAGDLNTLIFGDEVVCVTDPNDDEHPCPVLPTLLETLTANAQRIRSSDMDVDTKAAIRTTIAEVRNAILLAMRNARLRIDHAQKRLLDEKNPNRALSHSEQRCYLALGEQIPNQMPYVARANPTNGNGSGNSTFDGDAIAQAVTAGVTAGVATAMKAAAAAGVSAPPPAAVSPVNIDTSFDVDETDLENAEMAGTEKAETVKVKTGKAKNS
jgi:hypothetical protein